MADTLISVNLSESPLTNENIHNRSESWNKLHKTTKIQKLHAYAEKYGNQNNYSLKESRQLKHFITE